MEEEEQPAPAAAGAKPAVQPEAASPAGPTASPAGAESSRKGTGTKQEVSEVYKQYESVSLIQRGDLVRLCKCAKLYDPNMRKLALCFGPGAEALRLRNLVRVQLK